MTKISQNQVSARRSKSKVTLFPQVVAVGLVLGTALGCTQKKDIVILGEVRDPNNHCEKSLVEFKVRVNVEDNVPQAIPPDWCAIMDGSPELVCFLYENNTKHWSDLNAPRQLSHTAADPSHPDLECWQEELDDWENTDAGGTAGSAGESSSYDGYHPVYNNE